MWSPIIFIACLLAPTVPSDPSPQNLHLTVPGVFIFISSACGKDRFVTSSTIPIVNPFLGFSVFKFSNTAFKSVGVVSFDPSPYLPPTTNGDNSDLASTFTTSKYKGSPGAPGSLVLSSTHTLSTVLGIAAKKCSAENGLNK